MSNDTEAKEKAFNLFELCAACLMGLGAVGASVAGYQGGLWGGQMTDSYSESAGTKTKAASTYSDELASYIQDANTNMRAKEIIWEALESDDEDEKERQLEVASWMYLSQLSDPGYTALKLPIELKKKYEETSEDQVFTEAQLKTALDLDLDEDDAYENALFSGSTAEFKAADVHLEAARAANTTGDKFSLAGVIQTIGLFFAGLSLVFKTRVRWAFLGTGGAVFVAGLSYMLMLPWA